jgi:hypothetical protein
VETNFWRPDSATTRHQAFATMGQFLVEGHMLCCLKVH